MALRNLETLLAAARMVDQSAMPVDVLYSHLYNVMTCVECGTFGVERPADAEPTAGQIMGTDKSATGLPSGSDLLIYANSYTRHHDAQAALIAAGLVMCRCRLDALEFLAAVREANRAMIVIPEARRVR